MTNNALIPIEQAGQLAPAGMTQRRQQGLAMNTNFADGVRDAFPLLSIKGKVFRARISGQETPFVDPATRQAIAFLDVVLVNASRTLSKAFYIAGYTEGSLDAPDCWSMDSIRPDPSVLNKVSLTCVNCPMNAFGSRKTDNGKMAKACQDARRMAVVMPHQLGQAEPLVLMLRVPQTSLKNLKAYAQLLDRYGYEPNGCVTRLQFEYEQAYPKLMFQFVGPLTDQQYNQTIELAEGAIVTGMLNAPDFDVAVSPEQQRVEPTGQTPQAGPVLEDPAIVPAKVVAAQTGPVLETQTVAAKDVGDLGAVLQGSTAAIHAVASTVIELPDGKLFDTATGQYVERRQPEVQMPAVDPDVLALPDGKFFHKTRKEFVENDLLGAKGVPLNTAIPGATAAPAKPSRSRKPKEPAASAAATTAQAKAAPAGTPPALAAAAAADKAASDQAANLVQGTVANQNSGDKPNGNGAAGATVGAAPQSLEAILKGLTPPA